MNKAPLFSVIIPSYNCAQYIQQTLRSVYQQTEQDFEIIVINDGSPDNLAEILAQETDPRLRVITQPNGGVSRARNKGIHEAKGNYIAFLDSDDVWLPFHLEKAKIFFENYPQYHWYATKIIYCTSIKDEDFSYPAPANCTFYTSNWFLEFAPIPLASSTVLKKEKAIQYLHFPENIKMYEDNVAWANFAFHAGVIGSLSMATAIYRQRTDSATHTYQQKNDETKRDDLILQQETLRQFPHFKEAQLYFRKRTIYAYLEALQTIKCNISRKKIKERKYISGKYITFIMYVYTYIIHISTSIILRILRKKLHHIEKNMGTLLNETRSNLN